VTDSQENKLPKDSESVSAPFSAFYGESGPLLFGCRICRQWYRDPADQLDCFNEHLRKGKKTDMTELKGRMGPLEITAITAEEFNEVADKAGNRLSPFSTKVLALTPGTGFKTPCTWNHSTVNNRCAGAVTVSQLRRRHLVTVSTRCKDGAFYVFCPEVTL
jgi:hypothetical protein